MPIYKIFQEKHTSSVFYNKSWHLDKIIIYIFKVVQPECQEQFLLIKKQKNIFNSNSKDIGKLTHSCNIVAQADNNNYPKM
jgi:hypothetical protein